MQKILIVEDELYLSDIYQEILESAGFKVKVVSDGEAALKIIEQGGWDLIILDIMLPKMDGIQILDALKNAPLKINNCPILLLTNLYQEPRIAEKVKSGEVAACIVKSEKNPGEILEEVRKHISSK